MTLTGCLPDKDYSLAQCRNEARRTYPAHDPVKSEAIGVYTLDCMREAGYEAYLSDFQKCKSGPEYLSIWLQAGCYRGTNEFTRFVDGDLDERVTIPAGAFSVTFEERKIPTGTLKIPTGASNQWYEKKGEWWVPIPASDIRIVNE